LDEIWRALKGSRRAPKFHRGSWALSFGFSSYTRFYRACLNCYAMTPHELEFALIEEILDEAEDKKNNCDSGHEGNEDRQKELEELTAGEVEFVKRE